jgi:hypothetical protein
MSDKEYSEDQTNKLTDWENEPTLADLKADLETAKSDHDAQVAKIAKWLDNLHVRGKAKIKSPRGNSELVPKVIRKQAEWRYASLSEPFLSTDDIFNVSPITGEDKTRAYQNQLVLNNQFNTKIDKVRFIDTMVRSSVNEGTVIVHTGWDSQEEEVEEEVPVFVRTPDTMGLAAQRYMQLFQMLQIAPDTFMDQLDPATRMGLQLFMKTGQAVVFVIDHYETKTKIVEVKNQPTVLIVSAENIHIDPTCGDDPDNAKFIVYTRDSCLADLKAEGREYQNLDKIVLSSLSTKDEPDHKARNPETNFTFVDDPRKQFVVYEYWGLWDIKGDGTLTPFVAAWVGSTLIRMELNPYPDKKHPFVFIPMLPVKDSPFGEPDGALLEDNQKIIGAITRGMIDLMAKSANGQTAFQKNLLDRTNKRKFDRGDDYEFNAITDPRLGIYQHTYPEIPASAYNMLNIHLADAESLVGVKAFSSSGISGAALGDVASGVRGALDAASKREMGILRRLAAGVIKVGRKIISMNSEWLSDEEVIRITDKEFVPVRRDDLAGNFDLSLSISTAEEDDNKAKELAFMLQTMGNNLAQEMSRMILADIARLRKMPKLADKIESYQPQPDPIAQQKAMMEIQVLRAQVLKDTALAKKHGTEADAIAAEAITEQVNTILTMAKVDTEKAKARNLMSDSDIKDLNYVEQESGVKQERDIQKIGHQAHEQAKTKIVEALLRPPAKQAA